VPVGFFLLSMIPPTKCDAEGFGSRTAALSLSL
jgi:hypothetical protein